MAQPIRVGIIGGGWPGGAHARGYTDAGGFTISSIADLIPERRKTLVAAFNIEREYAEAKDVIADSQIDAVSLCLPTHLHVEVAPGRQAAEGLGSPLGPHHEAVGRLIGKAIGNPVVEAVSRPAHHHQQEDPQLQKDGAVDVDEGMLSSE